MGLVGNNTKEILTLDRLFERDLMTLIEDPDISDFRRLGMIDGLRSIIKSFAQESGNPWHCPAECLIAEPESENAYIGMRSNGGRSCEYIDLYAYSIGLGSLHSYAPYVLAQGSVHGALCDCASSRFDFRQGALVRRFPYGTDLTLWRIPKDCPLYPPVIEALEEIYKRRKDFYTNTTDIKEVTWA